MNTASAPVVSAPMVDIVVVTYNSAQHLTACLTPLQGLATVIVVDNHSTDESVTIARQLGAKVTANPDNRGFAAGANQGAALGTSPVIIFVNPDAVVEQPAVDALLSTLRDPGGGIVGLRLTNPDGSPQRSWWPFPSVATEWRSIVALPARQSNGFVVGAVMAVRREVFEQLGGLDESFWLYGEEADLYRRATDAGFRVACVDDVAATHVGGASSEPGSVVTFRHFARGADLFVLKHQGRAALLAFRVATVIKHSTRALLNRRRRDVHVRFAGNAAGALLHHPLSVPAVAPIDASTSDVSLPKDLVIASLEAWDEVWRRNQFLVRELQALQPEQRVLWVEPPLDLLHHALRTRQLRRPDRSLRTVPGQPGVLLFRPTKWLPRVVWPRVDRSLAQQVRRAAAKAGLHDPLLWLNDSALHVLMEDTGWPTVYDITDDWLSGTSTRRELRRLQHREATLMKNAADVVVCSAELQRRRSGHRTVHLIPNAVDVELFTTRQARPVDLPTAPVAVYVGSLHDDRIDVPLVARLARELPALSVCLVGPDSLSQASRQVLGCLVNVHMMGPRPYPTVPGYLQHAGVIVVPHAVNEFTESLDPIKAYEILAVGRPTVATPVAGFRELGAPVTVADGDHFVAAVRAALADPIETRPTDVPSWRTRAEQFADVLTTARAGRRIRVVYVGHCALRSGGELALLRLLPSLRDDVDAHVIFGEDGPMVEAFRLGGISVEVMPLDNRARNVRKGSVTARTLPWAAVMSTFMYILRLRKRITALDPDLVHTNTLKAAFYGGVAGRLAGRPVIWHVRDRIADDYLPGFAVRLVRAAAKIVPSAIIANSESTRATLGTAGRAATVTPSPVVFDPYVGTVSARPDATNFEVGMVGRVAPWKGQDVFLRAFATAFPCGTERARLVGSALFGEEKFQTEIRALAIQLGIADRVTFVGQTDDVGSHLERLSVLVHASVTPEPFGQVVVEGLSAGLPVIATDAGGPAEIITNGVDGLLVAPGDVGALSAAMVRLRDDPTLCARLGSAGRKRAEAFRPEHIAPQVVGVYRRVLADRLAATGNVR